MLQALWDPVKLSFVEEQKIEQFIIEMKAGDKGRSAILVTTSIGGSALRAFELFGNKCLSSW